jgi:hypothetical protein
MPMVTLTDFNKKINLKFIYLCSLFIVSLVSFDSFAKNTVHDWDPNLEIPEPVLIGTHTSAEIEEARKTRMNLISVLEYWRQKGLPNPPDLRGFYIITDVRNMTVEEVFRKLNPEIRDIRSHITDQYKSVKNSVLVKQVAKIFPIKDKNNVSDLISKSIFNFYCQIRYSIQIPNLVEAIENGWTFQKASEENSGKSSEFPMLDNAFYMQSRMFDVAEIFLQSDDNQAIRSSADDFINSKRLEEISSSPNRKRPVLVLLPRSAQGELGMSVSTLFDSSVSRHEVGHHMNHGLNPRIHRLVDEAFADYIAAVGAEESNSNPKIGEFFATASGEIARKIKSNDQITPQEASLANAFAKLGEAGFLRTMNSNTTIDDLGRRTMLPDNYTAGNPLRNFLWTLRQSSGLDPSEADSLFISVQHEITKMPMFMSKKMSWSITVRETLVQFVKNNLIKNKLAEVKRKFEQANNEKIKTAESALIDQHLNNPEIVAEINKLTPEKLKTFYKELAKLVHMQAVEQVLNKNPQFLANEQDKIMSELIREEEARTKQRSVLEKLFNSRLRLRIQADYVIPETLRAYYRTSQSYPSEVQQAVIAAAEKVMNAKATIIPLDNGEKEVIFVRESRLTSGPAENMGRIKSIIQSISNLRSEINALRQLELVQNLSEEQTKTLKMLLVNYSRQITFIQEYERAARTSALWDIRYVLQSLKNLFTAKLSSSSVSRSSEVRCNMVLTNK